jgi:SPP1 gp7 family putative phage head morphogenesis protein
MKRKGEKLLPAVRPNVGIEMDYRAKLRALIEEMQRSYLHWLSAQYRQTPPEMALDATPAKEMERELSLLGKRWQKRFNEAAPKLARYFATSTSRRSQAALKKILKDAGISVEFQMTAAMRDVLQATITEQVGLIKSIGSEYHTQVQGLVMRSVQTGRDLGQLTKDLRARYDITDRRAALIARDQNNKATANFTRVRQQEVGITEAIWLHSHGGKTPRKTHLANDGKRYNVAAGWFDPDPKVRRRIWPGSLVSCRCVSKSIVKGFS